MATDVNWRDAEQRQALLARILQARPPESACQTCLEQLDGYVTAQLAGQDYAVRFPEVAAHLDACPDCAEAYGRLYELELAAATGRLPLPNRLPKPDLSFLAPQAAPGLAEALSAAVRRLGNGLTFHLSAGLLPLLRPAPALAAVRVPADSVRYGEVLLALEPDDARRAGLPLGLTAYRDARRPEVCLLEVKVEPPGRSWPDLGGTTVTLTAAGDQRRAVTDAWGLAAFEGVAVAHLAQLMVEIEL